MNRKLRQNQDLSDEFPYATANQMPQISLPKHTLLPNNFINSSNDVFIELFIFTFGIISNFTQFLHLYRSGWYYNQSQQSIHLYLIDPHLVCFIITIISRRLIYLIINHLVEFLTPASHREMVENVVKYIFFGIIDLIFLYCNIKIFKKHSTIHIFYLLYP